MKLIDVIEPAKYFVISKPDLTVDMHRIDDYQELKNHKITVEPQFSEKQEVDGDGNKRMLCEILYI
jgi:hypothetical protein